MIMKDGYNYDCRWVYLKAMPMDITKLYKKVKCLELDIIKNKISIGLMYDEPTGIGLSYQTVCQPDSTVTILDKENFDNVIEISKEIQETGGCFETIISYKAHINGMHNEFKGKSNQRVKDEVSQLLHNIERPYYAWYSSERHMKVSLEKCYIDVEQEQIGDILMKIGDVLFLELTKENLEFYLKFHPNVDLDDPELIKKADNMEWSGKLIKWYQNKIDVIESQLNKRFLRRNYRTLLRRDMINYVIEVERVSGYLYRVKMQSQVMEQKLAYIRYQLEMLK
ncbi:hypothetical protein HZI73_26125 (plasmid) [Vallitalea pronyensis]|uniref:Uncharacterized protein n=1 Tax=Vallitalea pronyensis TaxID=1348613 RepID=A0A8J8MQA9_9FIRM|nr:hypothetical protein [Vallitalea pronyensis]QUI25892.1 hypothetical protein HZI73_26125 [Vallitalea pronyensis]